MDTQKKPKRVHDRLGHREEKEKEGLVGLRVVRQEGGEKRSSRLQHSQAQRQLLHVEQPVVVRL